MDATQTSLQVCSPFDREDPIEPAGNISAPCAGPRRDIGWVLKWTAAAAVLIYSTTVLTEFAYSLAAEQQLARAARAAILEATLPRATMYSVEQSARRRLGDATATQGQLQLALLQNGVWVGKKLQPRGGDRLAIILTMPAQVVMPSWLRTLTSWRGNASIQAHAERTMPGRNLTPGREASNNVPTVSGRN